MPSAWLARRRWLKRREQERPLEQLAAEASLWLEHPEPIDAGHLGTVTLRPWEH